MFDDTPSKDLMSEIQQLAFQMRLDNIHAQEQIDIRIKVLRARIEGPPTWDKTDLILLEKLTYT